MIADTSHNLSTVETVGIILLLVFLALVVALLLDFDE